jgi:hypothetical protein
MLWTSYCAGIIQEGKRWAGGNKVSQIFLYFHYTIHVRYPLIASIAKDHLAIPATSADSERLFSVGGDIITKKRNRLSPSTLRYLLCSAELANALI